MGTQLRYGGYAFQQGSVVLRMSLNDIRNSHNQVYASRQRVQISVSLVGNNEADITAQVVALQTACIYPRHDLVYTDSNGAATSIILRNAGSMTGVYLADPGIEWHGTTGAEGITLRTGTLVFEAIYPFAGTNSVLLDFRETLTFTGGGPSRVCKRAVDTLPQLQSPHLHTEYYATQSGSAVGFVQEPFVPGPIWPGAMIGDQAQSSVTSPHPEGIIYTNFPISWNYRFVSPTPLIGTPTRWKL